MYTFLSNPKKSGAFGSDFLKFKYLDHGLINYLINYYNSDACSPNKISTLEINGNQEHFTVIYRMKKLIQLLTR